MSKINHEIEKILFTIAVVGLYIHIQNIVFIAVHNFAITAGNVGVSHVESRPQ
ncbi:hypothetical protein SAMN05428962_4532 [Paenibacillus sp. BC26]|nr:hypothetical protein SAMN05428962_4532 [Paenibacillus sp. BC26]